MENDRQQCFNCGFFYENKITYYSSDFARYWSPSPVFSVNWCFHCKKVTIYKQVKVFGLFKINAVKPDKIMSLEQFSSSPIGKEYDYESGKVITQLIRLIWHCLLEHQGREKEEIENQFPTFQLALNTLSPEIVAFMMYILSNYNLYASLERQLQEGIYVGGFYDLLIPSWLNESKENPNIERVKLILDEYKSNN